MWWRSVAVAVGISATVLAGYSGTVVVPVEPAGTVNGNIVVIGVEVDDGRRSDVLMLIDEAHDTRVPDGEVDRVFRLQTESETLGSLNLQFTGADVAWKPRRVMTTVGGEEVLAFSLSEDSLNDVDRILLGFGLSHTKRWDLSLPRRGDLTAGDYRELRSSLLALLEDCDCNAGGGGSTSCSVGGCSGIPSSCSISCSLDNPPCCGCGADSGEACCLCSVAN